MIFDELRNLGFSGPEARVYMSLLELGSSVVSVVARKAGVPRVNCYHTLDNLEKRGLIKSFMKNKVRYFMVENPQAILDQKREELNQAKKLVPDLLALTHSLSYKPKISYYEGFDGIRHLFEDTISEHGEVLGYTNLEALHRVYPEKNLREYAASKIKKKIKTRMLSPLSVEAQTYVERIYPKNYDPHLMEILFVNPDEFMFEYEINIYGDRVSLISLNPDELIGVMIESPVYAKTQRAIFNLAWLGGTSFVVR